MSSVNLYDHFAIIENKLRRASIAAAGGFRPPVDPITSWFGQCVGLPGEHLPEWDGRPLAPVLQVRIDELPFIPEVLKDTKLLVIFCDLEDIPCDTAHGEGWLIREYKSLEGLVPLVSAGAATGIRPFPAYWHEVEDDAPSWDDIAEMVNVDEIMRFDNALETFHEAFVTHEGTKFGGYPRSLQGEAGIADFVFQIDSEQKVGLDWIDGGVAYFHKATQTGEWKFSCQFY